MRIAHLSDLHYCPKHLDQVDACMAHALVHLAREPVELAVITGDSTDHALDAHAPAFVALARRVRQLADLCPVLLLQGTFSHEPPGLLQALALVGGRHPVIAVERLCQVAWCPPRGWLVSTQWRFDRVPEGSRAVFSCAPTLNRAGLATSVGAEAAPDAVGESLFAVLSGFGVVNAELRQHGVATIGLGHGTVAGCVTEHGVPMAGLDHEFGLGSLAASGVDAFLLGHIHKHQDWRMGAARIAYAGSLARLHFAERGDKGFLVWTIDAGGARFEFVPTPAQRTVELEFEGAPDLQALRAAAAGVAGARVRVRFSVAEEDLASLDRLEIERILAQADEVKIEGRVIPAVRARAAGIGAARGLDEKLALWAQVTGVPVDGLAQRLRWLEQAEPDQIVREVLAAGDACPAVVGAKALEESGCS